MTHDTKRPTRYWDRPKLPTSKAEFFDAVTMPAPSGEGTIATIRMYGPIDSWGGFWGISTKDVGQVLDALPDSVTQIILRINSPGGEVFEALAILNMFRAHKANVTAVIDGLAASAASFIAAGCDETVMSPGTQMMIHSPLTIVYGNAADLRKVAEILDGIEASIVEIYTAKAGEKDWAKLLAEDTWMTTSEAMQLGLADRVAVVPDAGETDTVGDDDELELLPDEDEPDNQALTLRLVARASASRPKPPSSPEPVEPNQKENLVAYEDLTAGLRDRLGLTDADASDETLLAALDQALTGPASSTQVPAGTTLIDSTVLAGLQSDAAAGRAAREEQVAARRDAIIDRAVSEGRISAATRDTWRAQLDEAEEGTVALIGSLAANTIPVAEIGFSDGVTSDDDRTYAHAFGTKENS